MKKAGGNRNQHPVGIIQRDLPKFTSESNGVKPSGNIGFAACARNSLIRFVIRRAGTVISRSQLLSDVSGLGFVPPARMPISEVKSRKLRRHQQCLPPMSGRRDG